MKTRVTATILGSALLALAACGTTQPAPSGTTYTAAAAESTSSGSVYPAAE
jgi:hypothetical protein